jgi:hypothetical protein
MKTSSDSIWLKFSYKSTLVKRVSSQCKSTDHVLMGNIFKISETCVRYHLVITKFLHKSLTVSLNIWQITRNP